MSVFYSSHLDPPSPLYRVQVRGVLDAAVMAASGLPRVGSNAGSTLRSGGEGSQGGVKQSPSAIPATTLYEDTVVHARKVRGGGRQSGWRKAEPFRHPRHHPL